MSSAKQWVLGSALVLVAVRLAFACIRMNTPHGAAVTPLGAANAEAVSDREARRAEQTARIAELLEASVPAWEDRARLDEARGDASRALRDLAQEANRAGATKLGFAAMELEQSLALDARRTCSLDALKSVDAASSALTPAARTPLAERLAVVHRHVTHTCELATK
jgi:hypothetical protein